MAKQFLRMLLAYVLPICCFSVLSVTLGFADESKQPDIGLFYEDWDSFVQQPPVLLRIAETSAFQKNAMNEQYRLVNQLIELSLSERHPNIDDRFSSKVQMLSTELPSLSEAQGDVTRTRRGYYSSIYYVYRVRYTESVTRQAEPEMLSDFASMVKNVKASEIDAFIERVTFRVGTWRQRIGVQGDAGAVGIRKKASLMYLDEIGRYLQDWHKLNDEVKSYKREFSNIVLRRQEILSDWKSFERQKLPMLQRSMSNDTTELRADPANPHYFYLDDKPLEENEVLVARLVIGGKELFFDVTPSASDKPAALTLVKF